jgi:hypothetical protein
MTLFSSAPVKCRMTRSAAFLVNERGKARAFWAPPGVQLNHILAVVDASLKRWRIPQYFHRTKHASRRQTVRLGN